jgi:RNA 2',3'-cyclic 3'-phosphodiesterase
VNPGPGTARLFVAIPLPRSVTRRLVALQPQAAKGVRPIAEPDLHITLHFLGTAEVALVREALAGVRARPFPVRLGEPGHFGLGGRKTILWIGIEPSAAISELHAATAAALESAGYEPETRPWQPHITLARLAGTASRPVVAAFERTAPAEARIEFECARFALFESRTDPEGARYRVLERFPLSE